MLKYPEISPVIFQIGPLAMRWYGLMYAISFYTLATVMRRQAKQGFLPLSERMVERLFVMLVVFILLGARLFYVLFYGAEMLSAANLAQAPLEPFALWHGGLSFHGGFFGTMLASYLVARQAKKPWVSIVDTLAYVTPLGLGLGRLGNFINGELYGRVTNVPWGMVFPGGGPLPRHPSQLYESFLEGLVLFTALYFIKKKVKRHGIIAGSAMVGYSFFRIVVEFFREPDTQLGFILGPFTMGQLLSFAMMIFGIVFLTYSLKKGPAIKTAK